MSASKTIFGLAIVLVSFGAGWAEPTLSSQWSMALRDYAAGKYASAAAMLEDLDKKGLCNDNVHYYLGLCYQSLNQVARAQMHYQWVYTYSKDARLKYQAQVGWQQLSKYQAHRTYEGQGNNFDRPRFG
ncbi:MAG: hypothetical protein HY711_02290 [Candidatus Melainabacteria bacterium]|nr:hypothetical protein [Candidatus Melainabacteria bacterium]